MPIIVLSALTRRRDRRLLDHVGAGRTAVVLGSSGVGKSTLLNALLGEERQATSAVREDDSRGRHTTTHRELFALPGGALLIDTPGIRALEVAGADEGLDADVRGRRGARRPLPLRRLPPRGRARAAPSGRRSGDGTLSRDRLESHRKLEREAAHEARRDEPACRRREPPQVEGDPQVRQQAHDTQIRGGRAMTTRTIEHEIPLPDAPRIAGLRFRAFRDREDYAAISDVSRAANLHDDQDWLPTPEILENEFEHQADFIPRRDLLLAEIDGRVVAWGEAAREVRDGLSVYATFGAVDPAWRRRGIGGAIHRHQEAHLRTLSSSFDDPGGRVLGAWVGEKEGGAIPLLTADGYVPVRYGFGMRRPTLEDIPEASLPAGVELRPASVDQVRQIFDADNEAFRDHWGHREQTDEDFDRLINMPSFDPSLWSVAWAGDEVVGSVTTTIWPDENADLGVKRGWLEHISVRRPWRRQGVARALIVDAFRRLKAAGMEEAMLGVDSENPTGALQLYESLGFEVRDRGVTMRKAWEPGGRLV